MANNAIPEATGPIAELVARARAAQRISDGWSQEQVDMAVTAAGWAIIEPKRNRELAELVAMAKAKPGSLSYATVGNGSPGHLAGELFKLRTGTEMTHVPYRGGGPAVTDVMGGQVPLLWVSIPAAAQFVKAGKLKALAVSTTKRSAAFPDVPTMQEAGIPDFEVDSWYAMFVPTKTPKPAIEKLNRVVNTVVREPEIRDKLLAQGSEGVGGTPEQLGKVVSMELVRWNKLAKEASIKVD